MCPFCGLDPFEYVDVGIGQVPVAVNCCGEMEDFYYSHGGSFPETAEGGL